MRIDKFLKVARLIKRRSVAADFCDADKVLINSKTAKPSSEIKIGDIIEINFKSGVVKVKVKLLIDDTRKALEMYENLI